MDQLYKAGWFTPMLHVTSIERSIPFYEKLGFELIDTDRCEPIGWARMHCEGGAVMFLRHEHDHDHDHEREHEDHTHAGLYMMYTPDLPPLREQLIAQGINVQPIQYPPYAPAGECYMQDPDGNIIGIVHWGDKEHSEWLKRIGREEV